MHTFHINIRSVLNILQEVITKYKIIKVIHS